ncbi:CCA tRNA nucleotidyltransferase [Aestuariivirga litoralis]|uniref:CCA tRNA nucleotidyltransferase n=1 Tax=Aestuariivirga litoralis TaxID=2650924 RepID=A0A2W2BDW4_9HYPH|nr:CCA tRNA nucleotidyltransferase [Aestuariivirga litoralis]PZF78434.1 CCA tRNA nucleotidyltransferase [Aestuariivirga litoralis]
MSKLPSLAAAAWLNEPALQRLFAVLAAAGGEGRVAGGAVRNALLGEAVTEVDVATTLSPEQVTEACTAAGMGVHPTGIDHGTVTVVVEHHPFEVTTLRHDVETDGRRAKVTFTDDWEADAQRRDFTMNALYCDAQGRIYDFVDGRADVEARRVIFVGDPEQRITEDYLRILRFFRFHARYGHGAPDAAGLQACTRLRSGLDGLSAERIRQEMFKLMAAPGAVPTLQLMAAQGILSHLLPYTDDWRVLARLPPDPVLRLAALASDPASMKSRWRLSNEEGARLRNTIAHVPPSPALRPREQRAILYQLGPGTWCDLVRLAWARSDASLEDAGWQALLDLPLRWNIPVLPVTGHDLIAAGVSPGPEIGVMLRSLEDWWVASDFQPSRDELLKRLNRGT